MTPHFKSSLISALLLAASATLMAQNQSWQADTANLWTTSGVKVGIGTPSPTTALDVRGKTAITTDTAFMTLSNSSGTFGDVDWGGGGANDRFIIRATNGKKLSLGSNSGYDQLWIDTSGTTNLKTDSPFLQLSTTSSQYGWLTWSTSGGFDRFIVGASANKALSLGANGSADYLTIGTTGNVGINTTASSNRLHIYDGRNVVSQATITLEGAIGGWGTGVDFIAKLTGSASPLSMAKIAADGEAAWNSSDTTSQKAGLRFFTTSNGASAEHMRLDGQGNLTVSGNITTTGSITGGTVIGAVYQDLAEWVPATTKMEPGTVVVLNPHASNEVMPATHAYDTAVAGVVSAHPGVILGVAGESKAQVATTGRVHVKVDATNGSIAVGDLLVTSDKSGVAMKSQAVDLGGIRMHRPGTLIGKALEPLASGEGEILVLLSLQ